MDGEQFKALHKKYNVPKNSRNISVPKYNAEIWKNNLTSPYRVKEIRLQNIQNLSVKVQVWMVSKLLQILGYANWLFRCNADFYKNSKADSCLQGNTIHECMNIINATIDLLSSLGYSILTGKSILVPTQKIELLGFSIDSKNMKVSLTKKKAEYFTLKIKKFLVDQI